MCSACGRELEKCSCLDDLRKLVRELHNRATLAEARAVSAEWCAQHERERADDMQIRMGLAACVVLAAWSGGDMDAAIDGLREATGPKSDGLKKGGSQPDDHGKENCVFGGCSYCGF